MQAHNITTADFLDILFDGRNKDYGAYDLRKNYSKRLNKALTLTAILFTVIIAAVFWSGREEMLSPVMKVPDSVLLDYILPPKPAEPVSPEPPRPRTSKPAASVAYNKPRITSNDQVRPEDQMPQNDQLENVRIGNVTQDGPEDNGFPPAPEGNGNGTGVTNGNGQTENTGDSEFRPVEIESTYPGGSAAWRRFLIRTLHYPAMAQENRIHGSVIVKFIVDAEGNVSQIEAISGPEELRAEAVRVIRRSGKWIPAIQNHIRVKSYKQQVIVFQISEE